tara:strand:- start:2350 stop:3345 length:996 start_codon:yes stop_codon:yes gene_type:complete
MNNKKKLISLKDTIYVAGHKGMVGKAIVRVLNSAGYKNILTISRNEIDLKNDVEVKNWFYKKKPKVVILAAAKVGGIEANKNNPTEFLLENLRIQNNVIECAWRNEAKRFLFLGSSCIYPKYSKQPINEEQLLTSTLERTNECYAIAKIAGIKLCNALREQYGFDAISLMPTNLYGPGDNFDLKNGHVLASLIKKFCDAKKQNINKVTLWGTGKPFREFLHVDDLANACLFALEKWNPKDKNSPKNTYSDDSLLHLNVGTGQDISIYDLAFMISEIVGYEGEIIWDKNKPDGTPKKLLDTKHLSNMGWHAKVSLKEGLISTVKYYRDHSKT